MKNVLAFDLGASSGRAVAAAFDGAKLELSELHRFSNDPVMLGHTYYWDILRLLHEIKTGISRAHLSGARFDSLGLDETSRQKILYGNFMRLLGLTDDE